MSEHEDPKAIVEHRHAGLTITLPPFGFEGPRRVFFVIAAVVSLGALLLAMFVGWHVMFRGGFQWWSLVTLPIPLAIAAVGASLPVAVLGFHTRRGTITVNGQARPGAELVIVKRSIFGTRSASWIAADLAGVGMGDPDDSPERMPVGHLLITEQGGQQHGFFPERKAEELMDLAVIISEALGLDPPGA